MFPRLVFTFQPGGPGTHVCGGLSAIAFPPRSSIFRARKGSEINGNYPKKGCFCLFLTAALQDTEQLSSGVKMGIIADDDWSGAHLGFKCAESGSGAFKQTFENFQMCLCSDFN